MAILDTFTTIGPMSVCYPRLNSTVPLDGIKMHNPSAALDSEGLYLVDKTERLGLGGAIGLLLPEESQSVGTL